MEAVRKALQAYNIKGAVDKIALFGSGHINDTYLIEAGKEEYLLQKLNQNVFQYPERIENNLRALLEKESDLFVKHYQTSANTYHHHNDNGIWRLTNFVSAGYAPQTANKLHEVAEAAKGYGRFTTFADGLDKEKFTETIPKFHNLAWRLEQLNDAIKDDLANRSKSAKNLINTTNDFRWISEKLRTLFSEGLPTRVCHNDTKLDNCLLAKLESTFCNIIDLDTLGPGSVLYDFGDLMRTTLSPTAENELDESKIEIRSDYLAALQDGFSSTCNSVLAPLEKENLLFGGIYMTYIMAVRFLTDYLNGDAYYKISFENENFVRARNQLRLLELMSGL